MANGSDIVQTIKIEVEGADQASAEIKKVGEATTEVQAVAAKTGGGTEQLGKGLDQVSEKSGVTSKQMRALGKVMNVAGIEGAGAAVGFVKMAGALGPLGIALFAAAEAFSFIKGKMKEAEEAAKAIVQEMANITKISAEMKAESDASFWGTTAAGMKAAANDASRVADQFRNIAAGAREVISPLTSADTQTKAFILVLERAGIAVGDVMADTKKLGEESNKAALEAAKLYEKMSPIQKLNFEKVLKGLGFTDEQIKNIEKGSVALKRIQDAAAKPFFSPQQQQSIDNLASGWDRFAAASKRAWAMVAGDADTGGSGLAQRIGAAFATGFADMMAVLGQLLHGELPQAWRTAFDAIGEIVSSRLGEIKASIATFVTTAAGGAWQWIVDTFNAAVGSIGSTASSIMASIVAFVTTAAGGAWQWIVDTFNAAVGSIGSTASSIMASIVAFVTTAAGGAWQWIVDTFNAAVEGVKSAATSAADAITAFVTTPVGNAWQWIVEKWDAMKAALFGGGGGAPAAPAAAGGGQFAGGGLLGGRGTGTSDSNLAWVSRGEYITPASVVRQPGVLAFLEALRRSGGNGRFAHGGLIPAFAGGGTVGDEMVNFLDGVTTQLDNALRALSPDLVQSVLRIAKMVEKPMWDLLNLMRRAEKVATGGLLGGRGTGTSDSNLAWVSRGEHIMPARAVSQPGVLAFLEALRHSGGNLRDVLDGMGRFALGGMVRAPLAIPAFAGGGMNAVTINFPGLPEITGLRASSGVVDELRKAAAMAQVRSGGRKPSRYS